ncbi:MAG: Fic family protein [Balneolaceae bacterium]|nr:Fic family protein [Balneolaceae bacterium]
MVHAELLLIYPFRDGNGRTMRMLANLMSYKQGYEEIDLEPIGSGGEMRKRYIKGVQAVQQENYEPMIQLIDELFPSN